MQIERNCECEFVTWTLHVWFATHTLQVRNCNIHAFTKTIKCFLTVVVRVLIYLEGAIKEVQGFKLCLYTGFRSYKFAYFSNHDHNVRPWGLLTKIKLRTKRENTHFNRSTTTTKASTFPKESLEIPAVYIR